MRNRFMTALYGATALAGVISIPQTASAQAAAPAAAPAADDPTAGEIIVTARRRDESIVDVPLAITVVSAEKLQRLNLTSTRDIANFVPGLEFSDFTQGNSRNDRGGNRTIIFRGLNLANNGGGVQQAASMFLDGAAVLGNEIPGSLDVGAVEVLRGPQNVYFGRSTMTGAIAYRTASISKTKIGIQSNITLAERGTLHLETSISGPLIPDLLGFRVTGLYEKNNGFITNAYDPTGQKLGARSRRSLSGTLDFTPSSKLEIKGYANYFADEDGPSATVNIFPDAQYTLNALNQPVLTSLGTVTNCLVGTAATLNGTTTQARATICGRVPDISNAVAYSRTDIPAEYAALLFNYSPYIAAEHFKHMAGMQRHVFNAHAVINFQVSDYLKLQSITGYHVTTVVQDIDGAAQPIKAASPFSILFFGLANKYKDFSQEFRLSSDPQRALSWTVGANYVNARSINQAWNLTTTNIQPTLAAPNPVQTFNGAGGVFSPGDNRATTYGFFAGAYLKLFDNKLTLSAEGRYQIDDRFAQTLNAATMAVITTSPILDAKFKAFYPRVSVDYDVGEGKKIYASFAKGGRPGGFNSALLSFLDPNNSRYGGAVPCGCYAATVAKINALFGTTNPAYKQESLSIGELGFKGYLPHGKGYFDINTYYGTVSNQQVTQAQIIDTLSPPTTLSIVTNTGKTEIYGIEFTGNYNFTREISLDTTFAWNHTRRVSYIDNAPGNIAIYGRTDYSGLKLPLAPFVTASAVLSYEEARSDHWSPFGNAALVYRGKQYADIGNLAYTPGRATLDLRIGAKNDKFRVEAFVSNVFQNRTYPAGNVAADFGINTVGGVRSQYSGFFGAYADPRTVGVRMSAGF
ncbi:TonB-dependent receptor [Sphingomonas sp. AR_OL41]|uniref:TonB-dependent receptor n=1 Tax=Sphingomonas sp. AR_OL41 TaxID=3042729 RepID=UPI0024815560|nr:TonB-dependent receptor [Sphingomonas sp. AR_OL41]MDH7973229.1 TonB-dependent receptor [Sphingomonas sp. AR_OL41]